MYFEERQELTSGSTFHVPGEGCRVDLRGFTVVSLPDLSLVVDPDAVLIPCGPWHQFYSFSHPSYRLLHGGAGSGRLRLCSGTGSEDYN